MTNGLFEDKGFEGVGGTVVTSVTGATGALTTGVFFLGAIMEIEDQREFGVVVSLVQFGMWYRRRCHEAALQPSPGTIPLPLAHNLNKALYLLKYH